MKRRLGVFGLCLFWILLSMSSIALAEETFISVNGEARMDVEPDQARVHITIEVDASTPQDAEEQTSQKAAAVVSALKMLGFDDEAIETAAFSVYPVRHMTMRRGIAEEMFRGFHRLTVHVQELDMVSRVIQVAMNAGATGIGGVEFFVGSMDQIRTTLLTDAFNNAREKAEVLARAAGRKLGPVLRIQELGGYFGDIRVMTARAEFAAPDQSMSGYVMTGKQTLSASLNVVFELN